MWDTPKIHQAKGQKACHRVPTYIYIYIYGSTKKINDRDTQKSMTSEDQLCQFQVLAVCMQLCTLNWFQGTYMDQNIPHGAGVLQDYGKLGCSNQGAPFWFFNIHTYIYIYIYCRFNYMYVIQHHNEDIYVCLQFNY